VNQCATQQVESGWVLRDSWELSGRSTGTVALPLLFALTFGRHYGFSMRKLFTTSNTFETSLARMPAMVLSDSVATMPSRVSFPFFTMI
jgi:hypothetical protein